MLAIVNQYVIQWERLHNYFMKLQEKVWINYLVIQIVKQLNG